MCMECVSILYGWGVGVCEWLSVYVTLHTHCEKNIELSSKIVIIYFIIIYLDLNLLIMGDIWYK